MPYILCHNNCSHQGNPNTIGKASLKTAEKVEMKGMLPAVSDRFVQGLSLEDGNIS